MLEFLIESQRKISTVQEDETGLVDIRSAAEKIANTFPEKNFLGTYLMNSGLSKISTFVGDAEFQALLGLKSDGKLNNFLDTRINSNQKISSFFLAPGYWQAGNWNPHETPEFGEFQSRFLTDNISVRCGFLSSEFEIYESVTLGFRALTMHAVSLDHFQVQYFTEICRDLKISLIVIVDSERTLEMVLKTDAPYIGFWGYRKKDFGPDLQMIVNLAKRLPSACVPFAFYPRSDEFLPGVLAKSGIRGLFV